MPLLAQETDLFPDNLFDVVDANADEHRAWFAAYTRSRREKDLMRRLLSMEIPFYGPCIQKRQRSAAGRVRSSWVPLFSNYVFVFGSGEDQYRAHTTNCVSRILEVPDGASLTDDLGRLSRLISAESPVQIEEKIRTGTLVRVRSGPFQGCEGVVTQRRGRHRLVVSVRFLQQAASVELDDFAVETV